MKKLIRVTQEDIRKGKAGTYQGCPVALAVSRVLPFYSCSITPFKALFQINSPEVSSQWVIAELPKSAARFVERFDAGKPVKPFNFYLDIPDGT